MRYNKTYDFSYKTELLEKARYALQTNSYDKALELYQESLVIDSNNLELFIGKMIALDYLGKDTELYNTAKEALSKFGEHDAILAYLTKWSLKQNDLTLLMKYYEKWETVLLNVGTLSLDFYYFTGELFLHLEKISYNNAFKKKVLIILITQETIIGIKDNLPVMCNILFRLHELNREQFEKTYSTIKNFLMEYEINPFLNINTATLFLSFGFIEEIKREELLKKFFYDFDIFNHWSFILLASGWNAIWSEQIYSFKNIQITKNLITDYINSDYVANEKFLFTLRLLAEVCEMNIKKDWLKKVNITLKEPLQNDFTYILQHMNLGNEKSITYSKNKKLNIALCVSGQLRGYKTALNSWEKLMFTKHNVDIFVHTWADTGGGYPIPPKDERYFEQNFFKVYRKIWNILGKEQMFLRYPNFFKLFSQDEAVDLSTLKDIYKTNKIYIDDANGKEFSSFSNAQKMYYKIKACNNILASVSTEYDLVIRIRPDLTFYKNTEINWNEIYYQSIMKNKIFSGNSKVTDNSLYVFPGVGLCIDDTFAIGAKTVMDRYAMAYELTSQYDFKYFPKTFMAHTNLAYNVIYNDIEVETISLPVGFTPLEKPSIEILMEALKKDIDGRTDEYDIQLLTALVGKVN